MNFSRIALGLAFLAICAMRLPIARVPFYSGDEGVIAAVAMPVLEGGVVYRDSADHRGPAIYYAYALIFKLFGRGNMAAVHTVLAFLIGGLMLIIFRIGCRAWGLFAGLLAALLFAVFSTSHYPQDLLAFHSEWLAVFFSALAAWAIFSELFHGRSALLLAGGIAGGLAFLSKQIALLDFGVFSGMLFLVMLRRKGWAPAFHKMIFVSAGFLVPVGCALTYYFSQHALKDFWFYFLEYNRTYYVPAVSVGHWIDEATKIMYWPRDFFSGPYYFLMLGFIIFSVRQLYRIWVSVNRGTGTAHADNFIMLWALAAYGGASLSGRGFGHYYIMILPPFSLALARIALDFLKAADRRMPGILMQASRHKVAVPMGLVITGLLVTGFAGQPFLRHTVKRAISLTSTPQSYLRADFRQLSEHIRTNTRPDEKIFVWGWEPRIYVLADRLPASRYVYCNFLTGLIPLINVDPNIDTSGSVIPGVWEIWEEEMIKNRPVMIIDTSVGDHTFYGKYPVEKFPRLKALLDRGYVKEADIPGPGGKISFRVYKRVDSVLGKVFA